MNMSLGYNINVGPVTITPQVYASSSSTGRRPRPSTRSSTSTAPSSTNPSSPLYGQPGLVPDGTCPVKQRHGPCSDNVNYRKTLTQTGPRQFRFALKVTF